jgi:hypothetical protein
MHIQIEADVYSSGSEMRTAYADRLRRLRSLQPKQEPKLLPVITAPVPTVFKPRPVWIRGDISFDAHIACWREHLFEMASGPKTYIRKRCAEIGVSYEDIIGPRRFIPLARARQMLMWEVKQTFPDISWHQLGRAFGNRDHTTALHGVRKITQERAAGI